MLGSEDEGEPLSGRLLRECETLKTPGADLDKAAVRKRRVNVGRSQRKRKKPSVYGTGSKKGAFQKRHQALSSGSRDNLNGKRMPATALIDQDQILCTNPNYFTQSSSKPLSSTSKAADSFVVIGGSIMNAEYSKADFGVPAKKSSSVSTVAKASQRTQAKDDYIPVAASPSAKKIRNSVKYVKPGGERERPKQVLRPVRLLKLMNGDGTTWIRRKDVDADILLGVTKETIRIQFKSKSGKRELNPIALQNVSSCCRASASEHGDKLLMLVISMSKGKSFTFQFPASWKRIPERYRYTTEAKFTELSLVFDPSVKSTPEELDPILRASASSRDNLDTIVSGGEEMPRRRREVDKFARRTANREGVRSYGKKSRLGDIGLAALGTIGSSTSRYHFGSNSPENKRKGKAKDMSLATYATENSSLNSVYQSSIRRSARLRRKQRHLTPEEEGKIYFVYPITETGKDKITVLRGDVERCAPGVFLNDNLIDLYLRYLLVEKKWVSKENDACLTKLRNEVHVFSSFFYKRLLEEDPDAPIASRVGSKSKTIYSNVENWTKHVDIFSKRFLVVPVNESLHWSVAIICNPGAILEKTAAPVDEECQISGEEESYLQPCILIMDSLNAHNKTKIANNLRDYLRCEWEQKKRGTQSSDSSSTEDKSDSVPGGESKEQDSGEDSNSEASGPMFTKECIPMIRPTIPQQSNSTDCGVFVLEYTEQFCKKFVVKHNVHVTEEVVKTKFRNHLAEDWFPGSYIRRKREKIESLLQKLHKRFEELQSSLNVGKPGEDDSEDDDVIILSAKKKPKPPRKAERRRIESKFFTSPNESKVSVGDTVWFQKSSSSPMRKGKVTKASDPEKLWVKLDSGELYDEVSFKSINRHLAKDDSSSSSTRSTPKTSAGTVEGLDDDVLPSFDDELNAATVRTCSEEAAAEKPATETKAILT